MPTILNRPLTAGQQAAKAAINAYICNRHDNMFVLRGFSGCGKSTLVEVLLHELPNFFKMARLVNPNMPEYQVALTATTNKAAENLRQITGQDVTTIQSFLHLMVKTDYKTRKSELVPRDKFVAEGYFLVIDEASKIDADLLKLIYARTKNCKILFVGDPAQLLSVGCTKPPVFNAGYPEAALTEVVRQPGLPNGIHPITDLATQFRNTVNTGEWPQFRPDGHHVQWLERADFEAKMIEEFKRPSWKFTDSKVLAWTNKCVEAYNRFVREHVGGEPELQADDYAVVNTFVQVGKNSLKTDQLVHIDHIGPDVDELGVPGNRFTINGSMVFFMPKSLALRNMRLKRAKQEDDLGVVATIDETWIDLRAAYACTTDKAQGSTYDRVFIDLDDISRCNSGDQIARMLYVAVSRARDQVYLTGDIA